MPRNCCVPGCTSNYQVCDTSVFRFPRDEECRQRWVKAINRKDFTPTNNTAVCGKHFEPRFIITEDRMKRPDGSVITARRGTPKLTKDAYPTIFPNQPQHLSEKLPKIRTPQEKEDCLQARDKAGFSDLIESDKIENNKLFCEEFSGKLPEPRTTAQEKEDCVPAQDEVAFNDWIKSEEIKSEEIEVSEEFCEEFSGKQPEPRTTTHKKEDCLQAWDEAAFNNWIK